MTIKASTQETVCFSPNVLARDKKMPVMTMSTASVIGAGMEMNDNEFLSNIFSTAPQSSTLDYSTLVMTAEQSLERKWRKYFGGIFCLLIFCMRVQ